MAFLIYGSSGLPKRDFYQQPAPKVLKTYQPETLPLRWVNDVSNRHLKERVTFLTYIPGAFKREGGVVTCAEGKYEATSHDIGIQDVDNVLIIKSAAESNRADNIGFWESTGSACKTASIIGKVIAALALIGGAALFFTGVGVIPALVLIGAAALIFGLSLLADRRAGDAKNQVAQWKLSAAEHMALERTAYYRAMDAVNAGSDQIVELRQDLQFQDINAHFQKLYGVPKPLYEMSRLNGMVAGISNAPLRAPVPPTASKKSINGTDEQQPLLPMDRPPSLITPPMLIVPDYL